MSGLQQPEDVAVTATLSINSDSDSVIESSDRKFCSGKVLSMNGDLVAWRTHKQPTLGTSSTEAKHIALLDACKDGFGL